MKQFWVAVAELADVLCLATGRVVLFAAGMTTLIYLAACALDAVNDYLRGRAIRKGSK